MKKVTTNPLSADLVERVMQVIRSSGLRSVHYTGAADESLLRALISYQPKLEVSVMDMPDHWGTGYAFWYDEAEFGDCRPNARPKWLEGIPFYQEGAPDHEISIRDWPWDSSSQLEQIVKFSGRPAPRKIILLGFANMCNVGIEGVFEDSGNWERRTIQRPMPYRHPFYDWEEEDGLIIGTWKKGKISAYDRKQRKNRAKNSP